jgi:hypothetical protein
MRRRLIAGTAVSLLAVLAIGGPMASAGRAGPSTLQCGAASPPPACALLDQLATQLGPIAPLLGAVLAPVTGEAQGLAGLSDQPAGVPTAQVLGVAQTLSDQLGALPEPLRTLVGTAQLAQVTDTLDALIATLTAPVAPQESASGSTATPAKTAPASSAAPVGGTRSSGATSFGGAPAAGGAPSSATVPDVPVGDPLALAPLALPDFGFDPAFSPSEGIDLVVPSVETTRAAVAEQLGGNDGPGAELAVVAALSILLLAGAGIAQLQANRNQIAG